MANEPQRTSAGRLVYSSTAFLACVASVSSRVIARKLEREQKNGRGRGEEETLDRKPHDSGKRPLIFHGSVICKLTERQDRFTRLASHTDVLRGSSRVPAPRVTNP